jgi:hypothetical protein
MSERKQYRPIEHFKLEPLPTFEPIQDGIRVLLTQKISDLVQMADVKAWTIIDKDDPSTYPKHLKIVWVYYLSRLTATYGDGSYYYSDIFKKWQDMDGANPNFIPLAWRYPPEVPQEIKDKCCLHNQEK